MSIVSEEFGNVLTHQGQTIVCPVNTVGVMGTGLARAMRNRVGGLFSYYKRLCQTGELRIGRPVPFKINGKEQQVLLFPTKEMWKDNSELSYIEESLKYIAENYKEMGISELIMIPVGCGMGNLDYTKEVRPILYQYLDNLPFDTYILHREFEGI